MSQQKWNPLIGLGFASLGIGYLWEAYRHKKGDDTVNGLGDAPNDSKGVRSVRKFPAGSISEREDYIIRQMRKDSETKEVISEVHQVLSGRCPAARGGYVDWCVKPKDWKGEIRALYLAVVDPNSALALRYTRDHLTLDLFQSSALMRRLPAGDCDDFTIRLGAMLIAAGNHVRTRVVAPKGKPGQWSHIYLMVAPPGTRDFRPLDPTEPEKTKARSREFPFWEIESAYVDSNKRDREVM